MGDPTDTRAETTPSEIVQLLRREPQQVEFVDQRRHRGNAHRLGQIHHPEPGPRPGDRGRGRWFVAEQCVYLGPAQVLHAHLADRPAVVDHLGRRDLGRNHQSQRVG